MTTTQAAQRTSYSDSLSLFFTLHTPHTHHRVVLLARRKDEVLQPPDGRGHAPVCPGLYARGSRWYVMVGIEKRGQGREGGGRVCICVCELVGLCVLGMGEMCLAPPFYASPPRPVNVSEILDLVILLL